MSKSLARVRRALADAGCDSAPVEVGQATTAQMAADLVGCTVDQIAKSIMFRGEMSGEAILFITAGGNQVDADSASTLAGERLGKADAALIRAQTGFAIGGVAPLGHLTAPRAFFDPALLAFETVWAAAGTPRHVFPIAPALLLRISGAQEAAFTG
ncbi:MAG: YbaK/EbsC family protein [Pseudomonadota bacterium]|uniref:YbaK/EbsC family protein n=1 Tax=Roseovarius TaxID=74030 RepID=UPI0022A88143|nr:YbaK/EbsC family protein [Roseovarius sp. EGI FJ00037]MCZ0812115.1 YbaK/EbsC family protein [Roseovarius sp. EGI FJ00037]